MGRITRIKALIFLLGVVLIAASAASACDISYKVRLKALGETAGVELREGFVGGSRVIATRRSSGGVVVFSRLCPGQYFLAIGDGESVSVTEPHQFNEGYGYEAVIFLQSGSGNVRRVGRGKL
jgi:hypothetical protein